MYLFPVRLSIFLYFVPCDRSKFLQTLDTVSGQCRCLFRRLASSSPSGTCPNRSCVAVTFLVREALRSYQMTNLVTPLFFHRSPFPSLKSHDSWESALGQILTWSRQEELCKNFENIVQKFESGQHKHFAEIHLTVWYICCFSITQYCRCHSIHFTHITLSKV